MPRNLLPRLAALIVVILMAASAWPAEPPAFRVGIEFPTQVPVSNAVKLGLKEMGLNFINYYVTTFPGGTDLPEQQTNEAMIALCEELGLDFALACHMYDPPEEIVKACVAHNSLEGAKSEYLGLLFDELEHARVLHQFGPNQLADLSQVTDLPGAYLANLAGYRSLASKYAQLGSPVIATHVFPVLLHLAAESGFIPCPKICKEFYSPVSLAVGLGAAKQYGTPLWVDCDLWYMDLIPGHPAEELKSNLLLAYLAGADLVYIEGSGFNLHPAGNQGTPFSLINQINSERFQLTPHGEVLRWFCRDWLPANPRTWTFRDLTPDVAIVRFDDSDYGKRYQNDIDYWGRLFGVKSLLPDADTEAWLHIWDLLTVGKTGTTGLTYFKTIFGPTGIGWSERQMDEHQVPGYASRPVQSSFHTFFTPYNNTVVYDHKVGYDLLKDVPLIFATGKLLSDETWQALERRVEEGGTCIIWAPLAAKLGLETDGQPVQEIKHGTGRFVVTDDFEAGSVHQYVWPWLPRPDRIRFRFGDHEVLLWKVTENEVRPEVK